MPEATISKQSSDQEISSWVSMCIRHMRRKEGKTGKQAAGACYGIARHATGKELREYESKEKK